MSRRAGRGGSRGIVAGGGAAGIGKRCLLGHHRGNGVLEDQLLLIIGFQNQRVLIETLDSARELNPAHQINGKDYFVLPGIV